MEFPKRFTEFTYFSLFSFEILSKLENFFFFAFFILLLQDSSILMNKKYINAGQRFVLRI